jgi:hypothetical protein
MLRSLDRWQAVEEAARVQPATKGKANKKGPAVEPPKYHIGKVKKGDPDIYGLQPQLPWSSLDSPTKKFLKLFDAVGAEVKISRSNPNLQSALDNYLAMLWTLSLAAPLPYIGVSPFDLTAKSNLGYFLLSNQTKGGQAEPVMLGHATTVREAFNFTVPDCDPLGGFTVVIDGIELRRPIRLDDKLHAESNIPSPLLFVGSCNSGLEAVPATLGGGALTFEAYFYWNSKIIPKENIGVLVRINNASGTLFDKSFMNYQVSELTRLRQITAEIFVSQGLDPALNIDRESFNFSHPHYQFLTRWVHLAIRQVTNRLKAMAKEGKRNRHRSASHSGRINNR